MPLGLFSVRNFAVGNIATAFLCAALSVGGFIIVLQVSGFTATIAALALLPMSILNFVLSSWFGSLAGRFDALCGTGKGRFRTPGAPSKRR
ncbi:hypothetical protein IV498_09610 [Paenarthrobacter sp. Z7-10]|uniref:hypothetical protein n=1 Tax=Paenarthrobacter sp. Z7-10 TaxID=2787635 RepID=UPI0022A8FCA0|nr:hypothetical protein [Paenarthrobacter sp. Z7-10]MCZ2403431.1 hypothetical protein [Paenarthrobacter sp. Z7-10]